MMMQATYEQHGVDGTVLREPVGQSHRAGGKHRRVPSDPFEFDEPMEGAMFDSLKGPTADYGASFFDSDSDDRPMTVVDDHGSDSDSSDAASTCGGLDMSVGDFDFPETTHTAAGMDVERRGPDALWNDVDSWMLNVGDATVTPCDFPTPSDGWMNMVASEMPLQQPHALELVPVGRSSSCDTEPGVTPTALPFMSPCSFAEPSPSPGPRGGGFCTVGEKRARAMSGASPQHRMVKINRPSAACAAVKAEPTGFAPAPTSSSTPTIPAGASDCEPPPLLQKPLPAEVAARMLHDDSYDPGPRPVIFNGGQWLFKEKSRVRPPNARAVDRSDRADRWHNSGGVRGARDMPKNATPLVRRRYGSVAQHGQILYRFHEYSSLAVVQDPTAPGGQRIDEDRSTVVFHVMPKRSGKGRPSKAEAELPAQMWKAFGWDA